MKQKTIFALTLLGILLIIFLAQTKPTQTGTIKSIQISNDKTTINLENSQTQLIIFDKISINLKEGDTIKYQGKNSEYKNQEQIIVDKISLIN